MQRGFRSSWQIAYVLYRVSTFPTSEAAIQDHSNIVALLVMKAFEERPELSIADVLAINRTNSVKDNIFVCPLGMCESVSRPEASKVEEDEVVLLNGLIIVKMSF